MTMKEGLAAADHYPPLSAPDRQPDPTTPSTGSLGNNGDPFHRRGVGAGSEWLVLNTEAVLFAHRCLNRFREPSTGDPVSIKSRWVIELNDSKENQKKALFSLVPLHILRGISLMLISNALLTRNTKCVYWKAVKLQNMLLHKVT